jgi:TolB-like protein/DNA-binding winged helix-turn-helix (wHTH) protein
MDPSPPKPRAARFGLFEADFEQRILTKGGLRVRLQEQPFQVLAMLLERPGELVRREEIRQRLWPADTFVEFDDGLNTAVKKLRAAVNDSADNPRFIETVPRRGYRFLAPVTTQVSVHRTEAAETEQSSPSDFETPVATQDVAPSATRSRISSNSAPEARHWARSSPIIAVVTLALCIAAAVFSSLFKPQGRRPFASERATLVVIPLDNLSGDPQQEYFSDGFTEEISTQLARLDPSRLGVIGRLTAMRYKHSGKDIAQIAREIPVQYVLEGSVRRDQTRLRVTVQLIEASHQTHVWADEYDRDLGDTLGLQREIATAVAGQIKLKLTPEKEHNLALGSPATAVAHDAYLKGLYEWNKRTEEGFRSAIKYFEDVLQIQPDYAPAYAGLADSYNLLGQYGFARQDEAYPKAKAYAQKGLQLDGTLAEAYTALADVEIKYDRDWRGGERDFVRAIQLNANYATAHLWYAEDYLTFAGRLDEAIAEAKKAREIEPLSPIVGSIVAETFFVARDYDQAIHEAKNVLEMEPTFLPALGPLAWSYEQKGMFPEAIAEFQKGLEISHGSIAYGMNANLAHAYALSGNKPEARKILSELLAESRRQYFPPCAIAVIYTGLGEKDSALQWLQRCGQIENLPNLRVDPRFDSLRTERRFQELVRKSSPN